MSQKKGYAEDTISHDGGALDIMMDSHNGSLKDTRQSLE